MKALLSRAVGGPQTLELAEIPDPIAKKGEVLIRVAACGVNYPDSLIIEDRYQFKPERPFAPGGEISGTIEAVGEGVTRLKVGQRMLASTGWGGMAEKIAVEQRRCLPIPDAMPFDDAAAFLMTYGTSYYALKDRGALKPGETLLVLGAAGGVGSAAVELGKAMGARVIAAASSQEKADAAKSWGADEGIVYPTGPFDRDGQKKLAELFKTACGEKGADVIYDSVGGDYSEASLRAIAWEGRFLVIGFPQGIAKLPLNLALLKSCQVVGVFWGAFAARDPKGNAQNAMELFALYERQAIKPRISKRFPLREAGAAISWLAERRALGKVVVTVPRDGAR
jgi:NADPH2:quinone reductase